MESINFENIIFQMHGWYLLREFPQTRHGNMFLDDIVCTLYLTGINIGSWRTIVTATPMLASNIIFYIYCWVNSVLTRWRYHSLVLNHEYVQRHLSNNRYHKWGSLKCMFLRNPPNRLLFIINISSHPTQHPHRTTPTSSIVNKLTFRHTYLNLNLDPWGLFY